MTYSYWEEWLGEYNPRQPPFALILGDVGTGKTATLASINHEYHQKYDLPSYMVATKNELKHFPPEWRRINPDNIHIPKDAIFNGDDLHKYFHARDWADGRVRDLETLAQERGQTHTMMVLTTHVARRIDINLVDMASAIIIKKPTMTQAKFERNEIGTWLHKADKALEVGEPEKAYIVSNNARYEGVIDNIPLPPWWSEEASTLHRDTFDRGITERAVEVAKTPLNIGFELIKGIGKAFK